MPFPVWTHFFLSVEHFLPIWQWKNWTAIEHSMFPFSISIATWGWQGLMLSLSFSTWHWFDTLVCSLPCLKIALNQIQSLTHLYTNADVGVRPEAEMAAKGCRNAWWKNLLYINNFGTGEGENFAEVFTWLPDYKELIPKKTCCVFSALDKHGICQMTCRCSWSVHLSSILSGDGQWLA